MKGSSNAVEGIIVCRNTAVGYKACAVSTWAICMWGLGVMFIAPSHNISLLQNCVLGSRAPIFQPSDQYATLVMYTLEGRHQSAPREVRGRTNNSEASSSFKVPSESAKNW